jgi:membrane protein DedA with SNARE-associated domain
MLYNFIGAAIWAPLIAGIGYFFGSVLKTALGHLKRYELWIFGAVLLAGILFAIYHHFRAAQLDADQ